MLETPIFDKTMHDLGVPMLPMPTRTHDQFLAEHKRQWAKERGRVQQVGGRPKAQSREGKR